MALIGPTEDAVVRHATAVLPARKEEVGGDFQLVKETGPLSIALVGDVTGNGAEAAPYAEKICGQIAPSLAHADPAVLLEESNSAIYGDPSFDRFVTACAVVIDRPLWSARWAFAGHIPPHWLDTGLPVDGATPGLPLGVEPACGATSAERRPLRPQEGLLLFTDGLEDVQGLGRDRFGAARITHTLARSLNRASPEQVVETLSDVACEFGGGELPDDLCLLALRVS